MQDDRGWTGVVAVLAHQVNRFGIVLEVELGTSW